LPPPAAILVPVFLYFATIARHGARVREAFDAAHVWVIATGTGKF